MADMLNVFDLVFFIVIISSFVPGATVTCVARWLGIDANEAEPATAEIATSAPNLISVGS
jgi:NhaP-type Na+/H+ or K+/H+ antiporter